MLQAEVLGLPRCKHFRHLVNSCWSVWPVIFCIALLCSVRFESISPVKSAFLIDIRFSECTEFKSELNEPQFQVGPPGAHGPD